ncbi:MAG: metallophosphoesterase family protein [Thermodesulfobacteriota bacterium]|nr:metallophosphoesterase family protein [Thermodesulfobacteriota bacterium]
MLIYAVADIHGKDEKIDRIKACIHHYTPDVLVIAGDITSFRGADRIFDRFSKTDLPILYIRGNTDLKKLDRAADHYANIQNLDKKQICFQELCFTGISGTIPLPFYSMICLNEKRELEKLKKLVTKDTIVVAHPPCRGVLDKVGKKCHAGSLNLKHFITQNCPALLLCGHIHEQSGVERIHQTLVVNCAMTKTHSGALVRYEKDKSPRAKIIASPPDYSSSHMA